MADSAGSQLKSDALLDQMKLHLATDAGKELTKKIGLKIRVNEVTYTVDLKKGEVRKVPTTVVLKIAPIESTFYCAHRTGPYEGGKPDATFSFKDEDFLKVALGQMNPQITFMRGMMKIQGSISAAQKFTPDIFPKPSKM